MPTEPENTSSQQILIVGNNQGHDGVIKIEIVQFYSLKMNRSTFFLFFIAFNRTLKCETAAQTHQLLALD